MSIKLIFLDIDGVLNSRAFWKRIAKDNIDIDNKLDPQAIQRLNRITDETGAKLVISSTWRLPYVWNSQLGMLVSLLQRAGITGEIIGMTPDHQKSYGRGAEIQAWMDQAKLNDIQIDSFVILDDDSDMDHLIEFLIKTKFDDGLQDTHVESAILILEKI